MTKKTEAAPAHGVLAVYESNGTASVVLADGSAYKVRLEFSALAGGTGVAGGARVLVDRAGTESEVASGPAAEMQALYAGMVADLRAQLPGAKRGGSRLRKAFLWGLPAAVGVVALGCVALIALAPAPEQHAQATPEAVRMMLEQAQRMQGGFSKVENPVSLDDAAPPAADRVPSATQAAADAMAAPAAVPAAPAETQPPAIVMAPAAQPAAAPAADAQGAQTLLSTLKSLKEKAANGEQVTPEMLAGLPPAMADELRKTGILERTPEQRAAAAARPRPIDLPGDVVARSGRDSFGIADIPFKNHWVLTGDRVILPLPGGGDIKEPEDLARFGLQP